MKNIKLFVILGHDRLVGTVKNETPEAIEVEDPLILQLVPTEHGIGLRMMSMPLVGSRTVTVRKNSLIFDPIEPDSEIVAEFIKQTSGLILT